MRILVYQAHQSAIGGVETWNYNFCKRMSKYYDITFLCDSADPYQLERISKYVKAIVYNGEYFETDICIYSSAWGKRPEDHITAKRYIQMVHADSKELNKIFGFRYTLTPKTTELVGGGPNIAKTFEEVYGKKVKVLPYLLDDEIKIKPVLRLISFTRIAKGKGIERIVKMAKKIKESGRKFTWAVYGDTVTPTYLAEMKRAAEEVPELTFNGKMYDPYSHIKDAHYFVHLSDSEGYCFSLVEALSTNTPCIVTNFPNALELIQEGVNGYILKMDLSNLDLNKIYNHIPEFTFKDPASEEDWIKLLGKVGKRAKTKIVMPPKNINVKITRNYMDLLLMKRIYKGEVIKTTLQRANELMSKRVGQIV